MITSNKHANKLAEARIERRLSLDDVGRIIRRRAGTVKRYESAKRIPPLPVALSLEILYRTPIAFLYPEYYARLREGIRRQEESVQGKEADATS